jgi:hypothetical protein
MATCLVQVIQTDEGRRGLGRENSPVRAVTRYFTPDGLLLATVDQWLDCRIDGLRTLAIEAKGKNDLTTLSAIAMQLAELDALPSGSGFAG